MILYLWNEQGLFVGEQEVDEAGALPPRSTPTKPMKLTGTQVARWTGEGWEKLASAPTTEPVVPAFDLAAAKAIVVERNNAGYEAAIGTMTADYPAAEIQTWERQRAEVVAWAADSTVETPWITMAAQARGINRDEYLARTLAKVTAFAQASAFLTGRRQYLGDLIAAATTAEQLNAITIDYTLPGA